MNDVRGTLSLQPGTVIASRYEVVKCLGTGSMGLVYACRKRGEAVGQMVAVKVLFPEVARDKTSAARFRNEIFAAYGVSHPNVVRAYEYIREGDLVAYTMEFVSGGDLAMKLGRSSNSLSIRTIVKLLSQMCSGVQAIHDAGIVHRDLKAENILLTKDGDVKIADFGIARMEIGSARKLTEHGGVVGTIDYVAPEYLLSSQIDARADIYAIGILGYEMIAGELPFRGDTIYDTMWKRLKSDPTPPSQLRPECPAELDAIILKAMARAPEDRFQTARDMLEQLSSVRLESLELELGAGILVSDRAASVFSPTAVQGVGLSPSLSTRELSRELERPKVVERTAESLEVAYPTEHSSPSMTRSGTPYPAVNTYPPELFASPNPQILRVGSSRQVSREGIPLIVGPLDMRRQRAASGAAARVRDAQPPEGRDPWGRSSSSSHFSFSHDDIMLFLLTIIVVIGIGLVLRLFGVVDGDVAPPRPPMGGSVSVERFGFHDEERE